jgi:hypothetical protein
MNTTTLKYGYRNRSLVSTKLRHTSSTKIKREESVYYKIIGIGLIVITIVAITAAHLMPTVPL